MSDSWALTEAEPMLAIMAKTLSFRVRARARDPLPAEDNRIIATHLYFFKEIVCNTCSFPLDPGNNSFFRNPFFSQDRPCKSYHLVYIFFIMVILFLIWTGGMIKGLNSSGNLYIGDSKFEKKTYCLISKRTRWKINLFSK